MQISSAGGLYPIWSPHGRELFYLGNDQRIWVVSYTVNGDSFVPGAPRILRETPIYYPFYWPLDLAGDGKRFAVMTAPESPSEKGPVHVTVLENFFDKLKRKVPAGR